MNLIDKIIMWYLVRYNRCFIQSTMYGPKIMISFKGAKTWIEEHTLDTHEKYGTIRELKILGDLEDCIKKSKEYLEEK